MDSVDSVDSVETVDKTPSILRVYRGYSAGIGGVFRGLFRRGGQVSVSVVGCQLSVSVVSSGCQFRHGGQVSVIGANLNGAE